ncbi:MAG TPA: sulfite exporter TauE/SafE family protein [Bryobacteraceae bacterium]|nr:sulfite exporter TauE/SafE family protein [Bryobacteraceae bacterium]
MADSFSVWLFAVSIAASALGGMLGMASGIFIVPLLTIFGHIEIHTAVGASIVSVIACSCGGAAPFLKNRLTNIRLAIVLETATTTGALSGVLLAGIVPVSYLYLLFAVILFLSAHQMLARRRDPALASAPAPASNWSDALDLDSRYHDRELGREVTYRVHRVALGMVLMYGAGLISALLGIGSGVLKIPAMDTAMRLPIKVSSATSNFMIGVTAAASAGVYFMRGSIVTEVAGPVAFGSVLGAIVGARMLLIVPSDKLRLLFVVILVVLGIQMLRIVFSCHLIEGSL